MQTAWYGQVVGICPHTTHLPPMTHCTHIHFTTAPFCATYLLFLLPLLGESQGKEGPLPMPSKACTHLGGCPTWQTTPTTPHTTILDGLGWDSSLATTALQFGWSTPLHFTPAISHSCAAAPALRTPPPAAAVPYTFTTYSTALAFHLPATPARARTLRCHLHAHRAPHMLPSKHRHACACSSPGQGTLSMATARSPLPPAGGSPVFLFTLLPISSHRLSNAMGSRHWVRTGPFCLPLLLPPPHIRCATSMRATFTTILCTNYPTTDTQLLPFAVPAIFPGPQEDPAMV